jgi:NAD(P)-dependent dehydrogenase (short-subunit alcohol dehydrogenase family)
VITTFDDRVVAITGAGSGIGRALAIELARRGARLALSDIDGERLEETNRLAAATVSTTHTIDTSDRQAVEQWAADVASHHGQVNVIVNNAGVALVAPVESMELRDFEWLMGINFWGVVHGTQAFLPHLKASREGHVVNVSSVFGLMAIPSQSAYNASKFAVRGFTDALRIELEVEPCGVSATTIHPGGIRTNIARDARVGEATPELREETVSSFDAVARTTPERAAEQILAAVLKNRRRALVGPDAIAFDAVSRMPAVVSQKLLSWGARKRLEANEG